MSDVTRDSGNPELVDFTLTQEIRSLTMEQGLDLFGVAPVARFAEVPESFRPEDYLPGARTVVSIGCAIADDFCDNWGTFEEEGKSPLPYMYYGLGAAYWELARVANRIARRIEYQGYRSTLFPPHWSVSHYRSITTEPTGWPLARVNNAIPQDFPHLLAAVAAGLGQVGWSGLVLTPDFGPRVRFNSIITDAPLSVDPILLKQLCQPERCGVACAGVCPAGALSTDLQAGEEVAIAGSSYSVGRIDAVRCHYGLDGLVRGSGSRTNAAIPDGPGDAGAYRQALAGQCKEDRIVNQQPRGSMTGNFCERCLLECPAHTWGREQKEETQ
jgi:epoxyqueuosine reductase